MRISSATVCCALLVSSCHAFQPLSIPSSSSSLRRRNTLFMADAPPPAEEPAADDTDAEDNAPPPVDPEMEALQKEISDLESALSAKRKQVGDTRDRADDMSKGGYARKVAEMENMRRARSMLQSTNKYTATAKVCAEFLPALDCLDTLRATYENDEFGKQYNAMPGAMRSALTELGVREYTIQAGEVVDESRMQVVESRHDEAMPANQVLMPIDAVGLELEGNIMRLATCMASLGSEEEAEEEEEVAPSDDAEAEAPAGEE